MTASIRFDETSVFCGFTVSYKLNDEMSKTMILAESYRRLEMVLESLNLTALQKLLKDHSFVIMVPIESVKDGDIIKVSCAK